MTAGKPTEDAPNLPEQSMAETITVDDENNFKVAGKAVVPYFHTIQKMVLYETKTKFYLVGSNQSESKFRLLKIDRNDSKELQLFEDPAHYTAREMKELLATIAGVNRTKTAIGGLVRSVSAFGILGFVRFLEGHYIILITKRRKVATIGHHAIYKIEDTACIYIPWDGPSRNPDELRYLKLFQSIDLSSNFYFAYSYDLTNTLQYNMTTPKRFFRRTNISSAESIAGYGITNIVNRKYVWNSHLLKDMEGVLHPDWILYITHAFIGQSNICVYGRPIYLTIIARRSAEYAGTRFLKRGANFQGEVANEVETEQIVFDASVSSFKRGLYTSFVQMRGSIPVHWSQDTAKMVAKPPIGLDIADPFAETAGKHFGKLLHRFGAPLVVLNLVKKRERKRHESILTEEYVTAIKTLNQFLPAAHRIHYIGFDMARTNKAKEADVMSKLANIAEEAIRKTKFFQSHPKLHSRTGHNPGEPDTESNDGPFGQRQTGLVRVNCVDCLDRTNTAQFALGKCALVHQLRALCVLDEGVHLDFESDAIRMLEELYEDHGDTLALQYGGSQLVHRINTYRKTAPWTSQGNDIMQTLSRYYSNTFSDADKQNAINLFLGVYQPSQESSPLWALENDLHLHLRPEFRFTNADRRNITPITEWYTDAVLKSLPNSCHELQKTCVLLPCEDMDDLDSFSDFFKTRFFVPLSDVFAFKISHSIRDFMPHFTTEFSPFVVRVRPGKRQEETTSNKKVKLKNPSIMGLVSTSSGASAASTSSEESDFSSSEEFNPSLASSNAGGGSNNYHQSEESGLTFSKMFPDMKETYGVELKEPRKSDVSLYKKFVHLQQIPTKPLTFPSVPSIKASDQVIPLSGFSKDSCYHVTPPTVSKVSRDIYRNYVQRGITGAATPSPRDLSIYKRHVKQSGNPTQFASS